MECPICYEAITDTTGQTTMGCKHSFHFACIANWFYSQNENGLLESCPCCRHEALPIECLPKQDDSSVSESELSVSESLDSERDYSAQFNAALLFITKREELSKEAFEAYAATRIQAFMRAHRIRNTWIQYYSSRLREAEWNDSISYAASRIEGIKIKRKYYEKVIQIAYGGWHSFNATKIQALWRGFISRKKPQRWTYRLEYGGYYTCNFYGYEVNGSWAPGEDLPPQSLEYQMYSTAKRIQTLWRGYLVRRTK